MCCSMRWLRARSTSLSITPARSGPIACSAKMCRRASKCSPNFRDGSRRRSISTCVGPLGFENAYTLAMTKKKADTLNIRSIADLAAHASELSVAGDYEIFARPEWASLRSAYGLNFRDAAANAAGIHVQGRRRRRGRRDRGLYERWPNLDLRPHRACRRQTRDPVLRRNSAGLAQTRQRRQTDCRAEAPGRLNRRRNHARSKCARLKWR